MVATSEIRVVSYYGGPQLIGPMVYIKIYIFTNFYQQYLVLLTMVPRDIKKIKANAARPSETYCCGEITAKRQNLRNVCCCRNCSRYGNACIGMQTLFVQLLSARVSKYSKWW